MRPTCYLAGSGGESVIRLSLGKLLLVNLSQVVKRTNTPQIPWHSINRSISTILRKSKVVGSRPVLDAPTDFFLTLTSGKREGVS